MEYIKEPFLLVGEELNGYTVEMCPVCRESTKEVPDDGVMTYNQYNELGRLSFV